MAEFKVDDSTFEYDELKLFFREDYKINDHIVIHQPTIGDIVEYGEKDYYEMLSLFCVTADGLKCMLWDMGVDWNDTSDFAVFLTLFPQIKTRDLSILFGDLDFTKFDGYQVQKDESLILYDPEDDIVIDEFMYENIVRYIRKLHGIVHKPKKVKGKMAKEMLIEKEKYQIKEREAENAGEQYQSQLLDLVSSMLVYPGFKYNSTQLKECGIYEFMNAVQRAQVIEQSLALTRGAYSGFMDTKKVNPKSFNWLRPLDEEIAPSSQNIQNGGDYGHIYSVKGRKNKNNEE